MSAFAMAEWSTPLLLRGDQKSRLSLVTDANIVPTLAEFAVVVNCAAA
jgi:hypothetical protein